MERQSLTHPIPSLYTPASRVLILGSFPSAKSREEAFFYAHPQNRFWRVLAAVFNTDVPRTVEEKKALILNNRLALWDTIASCEIAGSSDASITHVTANDLRALLAGSDVRAIFCNGAAAHKWYVRLLQGTLGREAVRLPSTSPANAAWPLERLIETWRAAILPYLKDD